MARPRSIEEREVLRAARDVFIARGAEATTREVAEAAGVSQAVLFQRYGTKQRLYFAAMLPAPPSLDALVGELPPPGAEHARAYLVDLSGRLLAWLDAAMPGSLRAALHPDFPAAFDDAHAPVGVDALAGALAERVAVLQSRADVGGDAPGPVVTTLLELLHGQALAALLGAGEAADDRAERAVSILWRGLDPGKVG
jgi:AcrR family transcriptional regulator